MFTLQLAAYKKKKHAKEKNTLETSSNSNTNSDSSFSLSPTLLPENNAQDNEERLSDTSSISEHILSSGGSIENDRSFQEIEVSHVPSNFSLILQNINPDDIDNISQENKPISFLSDNFNMLSLNMDNKMNQEASKNVQSILEEILNKQEFHSDLLQNTDVSINSNLSSLNIFEGINLDDKSINSYVSRLKSNEQDFNVSNEQLDANDKLHDSLDKMRNYEELITTKDLTITALNAELDSLREIASNPSTMSLNTTTTEYKQFQEEYRLKVFKFLLNCYK